MLLTLSPHFVPRPAPIGRLQRLSDATLQHPQAQTYCVRSGRPRKATPLRRRIARHAGSRSEGNVSKRSERKKQFSSADGSSVQIRVLDTFKIPHARASVSPGRPAAVNLRSRFGRASECSQNVECSSKIHAYPQRRYELEAYDGSFTVRNSGAWDTSSRFLCTEAALSALERAAGNYLFHGSLAC